MAETNTCKVLTALSALTLTLAVTACGPHPDTRPAPEVELKSLVDTAKKQCQTVIGVWDNPSTREQSLINALTAEGFSARAERTGEFRAVIIFHNPKHDATCALKKES